MSTCSDLLTAAQTIVNAGSSLVSLDPSTLAGIYNTDTTGTPAIMQLSAGGPALLTTPSSPSLDGTPFRISLAGYSLIVETAQDIDINVGLLCGDGTSNSSPSLTSFGTAGIANGNIVQTKPFFLSFECLWNSGTSTLTYGGEQVTVGSSATINFVAGQISVSSQTGLKFFVNSSVGYHGDTVTFNSGNGTVITQFKASLV